jgi:hypothetical protein
MQDEGVQAPADATGGKAQMPPQPVVEPEHPQQPQPRLPLAQPSKPQQPQPAAKLRQPLAKPYAPKLQHLQLLEDLEDAASEENGVAARINVLSDGDNFDVVQPLPALGDAKGKQPQKLAGDLKKRRKQIVYLMYCHSCGRCPLGIRIGMHQNILV